MGCAHATNGVSTICTRVASAVVEGFQTSQPLVPKESMVSIHRFQACGTVSEEGIKSLERSPRAPSTMTLSIAKSGASEKAKARLLGTCTSRFISATTSDIPGPLKKWLEIKSKSPNPLSWCADITSWAGDAISKSRNRTGGGDWSVHPNAC